MKNTAVLILIMVLMLVAFCFGRLSGEKMERKQWRKQAIEHRVAKWVVNPLTGEVSFEWLWGEMQGVGSATVIWVPAAPSEREEAETLEQEEKAQ